MNTDPTYMPITPSVEVHSDLSPISSPPLIPPHPVVSPVTSKLRAPIYSISRQESASADSSRSGRPPGFEAPRSVGAELHRIIHLVETQTPDLTEDEKEVLTTIFMSPDQVISLSYLLRLQPQFVHSCENPEFMKRLLFQVISLNRALFADLTARTREQTKIEKDTFQVEHILRRTIGELQKQKESLEVQIQQLKSEASALRQQAVSEKADILRKLEAVRSHLDEALPELVAGASEMGSVENEHPPPPQSSSTGMNNQINDVGQRRGPPQFLSDERAVMKQTRLGRSRADMCSAHGHRRGSTSQVGRAESHHIREHSCLVRRRLV